MPNKSKKTTDTDLKSKRRFSSGERILWPPKILLEVSADN